MTSDWDGPEQIASAEDRAEGSQDAFAHSGSAVREMPA